MFKIVLELRSGQIYDLNVVQIWELTEMSFAGAIRTRPLGFLFGLAAVSLAALLLVPPIPRSQIYHSFADRQTLLGIPNFWNVASNLPFILVGVLGLANVNVRRELSA